MQAETRLIIAGDIGGTKTLLQLAEIQGDSYQVLHTQAFKSAPYTQFETLLDEFIKLIRVKVASDIAIEAMCLGVAGPVTGNRAQVTNLPWLLDAQKLEHAFNIKQVSLINDFTAIGYGIEHLKNEDMVCLQQGEVVAKTTRAVIGAGTGLGEGYLVWQNGKYIPMPSEGGHVDFAPQTEEQIGLLKFLQQRHGHVSYERIVSGNGLVAIYEYILTTKKYPTSVFSKTLETSEDAAANIAKAAITQNDSTAVDALNMFVQIYGAQAGNLALTTLARGGVYIAGGIAPKILDVIKQGGFISAFQEKGRFRELMQKIPVYVVVNIEVGLIGARHVALEASGK